MRDALASAPAWYVASPAIGLLVAAILALTNQRLSQGTTWSVFTVAGICLGVVLFSRRESLHDLAHACRLVRQRQGR